MTSGKGISGTGIASLFAGSLLLWSAIKGRAWSQVLRELISGESPTTSTDYPITAQSGSTGSDSSANGTSGTKDGWESARASSFWGMSTATGRMTANTVASPYLPLGTRVEIEYKGKTVTGVINDFGPADWVMRMDPDRFLDIAEPMMQTLTGQKSTVIRVNYRVTSYGSGRIYRPNAAKTTELRKRWAS